MVQTYSDGKYIYSVDMMFAYIEMYKPKYIERHFDDLLDALDYKGWGEPDKNVDFSPKDVLENPKKYKKDYERIQNADLSYPIIIADGKKPHIIDGVHRLTKAYIKKKTTIKAYVFDKKILSKFIIAQYGEWDKIDALNTYDFIITFVKRFCD